MNAGKWCWTVLGVTILAGACTNYAADWPQWGRDSSKNMISTEKNIPATFDPGKRIKGTDLIDIKTTKNVKWVAKMGSQTYGNPTVANGRVYVGTNFDGTKDARFKGDHCLLKCLDEKTGKLIWQLVVPKLGSGKVGDWELLGICSSAAVDGDRVYIVSNRCEVLCLDANGLKNGNQGFKKEGEYMAGLGGAKPPVKVDPSKDADIIWRYDMRAELGVFPHNITSSSILVTDDKVWVVTSNGVEYSHKSIPNPKAPALIALGKKGANEGKLVAEEIEGISTRILHGSWSSPTYGKVKGKGLIFFGGPDGYCYAFDEKPVKDEEGYPVLKMVWKYDGNLKKYRYKTDKKTDKFLLDKNGKMIPRKYVKPDAHSEFIATPVFYKNRIYIPIGQDPEHGDGVGRLVCIDATKTGEISSELVDAAETKVTKNPKDATIWEYNKINRAISTVSIADGLLYVADFSGYVYCLDAETGKLYWRHDSLSHIWGSTLVVDGKVFIGNADGDVTILAAGKEKKVLATINVDDPVYSSAVAANGVLYIGTQTQLYAISASK